MEKDNVYEILRKHELGSFFDVLLYREFSKKIENEEEIIEKINDYNEYVENAENKYPEKIMQYLRQREGLNKYDYSKDDEYNKLAPNKVFEEVIKWNGLMGGFDNAIKDWVKGIYGVDLNEIKEKQIILKEDV